ncbi:MAG: hypothetical protein ABIS69_12220, partial [Sediminibacterium sp.]
FLKPSIGSVLRGILIILLLLPIWMFIAWLATGKRKLVIAIIDKTVLTTKGQEHISLNWVLNQEKFSKTNTELYKRERDYYGFFPLDKEKFLLKGLERFNTSQLNQLSADADAAYITDAYGIYKNEWFKQGDSKERSGIVYGGLSQQDFYFLQQMRAKHKLIITEFNCLASPTSPTVRSAFETEFGIRWTGWIGRYFDSFDTTKNKELPKWLVNNYKLQHKGAWPFTKSGIAFIHSDERIVVLENETHLLQELPYIYSTSEGQDHYGLPEKTPYSFWFDIIQPDTSFNHVISNFQIEVNEQGKKELAANGLSESFPAVTAHINDDYRFFYFSADFADNPISLKASYFKGVHYFKWLMYNRHDPQERKSFFWNVYQPLVSTLLNDYYFSLHSTH